MKKTGFKTSYQNYYFKGYGMLWGIRVWGSFPFVVNLIFWVNEQVQTIFKQNKVNTFFPMSKMHFGSRQKGGQADSLLKGS